jgi:hypothetical protein
VILSLVFLPVAWAFGERVHEAITERALRSLVGPAEIGPARAEEAQELVALVDAWARASRHGERWAERYPAPSDFDTWALKELLSMNPEAQVYGLDLFDTSDTFIEALTVASRRPDDDGRNRGRLAHGADRGPISGVPDDPIILNMGALSGVSSQAHAHYGLSGRVFSSDPEVLKSDPVRFAVPVGWPDGPVVTLAPEMAQAHADVATLAFLAGHDGLGAAWFGAALHYLEDVGNPVHTVQVGAYEFFEDAYRQRLLLSLQSGGGYFGDLPSLASIGMNSITNHHLIGEALAEERLLAGDKRLAGALVDVTFDPHAPPLLLGQASGGPWMARKCEQLIDASGPQAVWMYRYTRAIVEPRFRSPDVHFEHDSQSAEGTLRPGVDPEREREFMVEQRDALRRSASAVWEAWSHEADFLAAARESAEATDIAREETLERLVSSTLSAREAVESRRAAYLADPPPPAAEPARMPAVLAAEVGVSGLLGFGLSRLLRRARGRG